MKMRTLNLGCGRDKWGTDKLDLVPLIKGCKKWDFNKNAKMPYKNNTFNEIHAYNLLECLANPQFFLDDVYRILKPKGKFEILTHDFMHRRFFLKKLSNSYDPSVFPNAPTQVPRLALYDENTIRNRLILSGFKNIAVERFRWDTPFKDQMFIRGFK